MYLYDEEMHSPGMQRTHVQGHAMQISIYGMLVKRSSQIEVFSVLNICRNAYSRAARSSLLNERRWRVHYHVY